MTRLHTVLALAATALAFTISVPQSARAQAGPFTEFLRYSQRGSDARWLNYAEEREEARAAREQRLKAQQRELLQRWQQRMWRSAARQEAKAQYEKAAKDMQNAIPGGYLWGAVPGATLRITVVDANSALEQVRTSNGGSGSAATGGSR